MVFKLFAILQKYDFSSKSQPVARILFDCLSCLRYCKSTIFQANHNSSSGASRKQAVVCDTAKVRFFKQITTTCRPLLTKLRLFAILQKYDFSSKSQQNDVKVVVAFCCLRYCKSTIFQANHNVNRVGGLATRLFAILQKYDFSSKSQHLVNYFVFNLVVCDTAKVRFFKQITTLPVFCFCFCCCLRYCKSTIFQANHNQIL